MSKDPLDKLINNLSDDLVPVKKLPHPLKRGLAYIVISLLYVGVVVYFQGCRTDIFSRLSDHGFLFEIILMFSLFVSATFANAWLCVPDMRGQSWILAVPLTLLGVFAIWVGLDAVLDPQMPSMHMPHCVMDGALIAGVPAAIIVFFTCYGNTTRPVFSSTMGMLAMGSLGYGALRFTCMNDALAHVGVYHILPFVIGGGILGAIAQRLYRW